MKILHTSLGVGPEMERQIVAARLAGIPAVIRLTAGLHICHKAKVLSAGEKPRQWFQVEPGLHQGAVADIERGGKTCVETF
jgi:hypothetical protein